MAAFVNNKTVVETLKEVAMQRPVFIPPEAPVGVL
jgi:hypothetical protein